jgi:voltage-gated potassium channel Kch
MALFLDDGPGRAVVIFDAGSTLGAFIRVDDIALLAFGDSTNRTLVEAAAALDAVFRDFIGHDGLLQAGLERASSICSIIIPTSGDASN